MKSQVTNTSDHKEIVLLLPWYVNQTLEEHQKRVVSSHIENCEDCQREVELLTSVVENVQADARSDYKKYANADLDFANVMSQIDAQSNPGNTVTSFVSLMQRKLGELFKFLTTMPITQLGATALAGLLVAVIGFQIFYGQSDTDYSVLSSSDISNPPVRLSVEIVATDNQQQARSEIQYELEKIGQQPDIETETNNELIIVFKESIGVTELSDLIGNLENAAHIERVHMLP